MFISTKNELINSYKNKFLFKTGFSSSGYLIKKNPILYEGESSTGTYIMAHGFVINMDINQNVVNISEKENKLGKNQIFTMNENFLLIKLNKNNIELSQNISPKYNLNPNEEVYLILDTNNHLVKKVLFYE